MQVAVNRTTISTLPAASAPAAYPFGGRVVIIESVNATDPDNVPLLRVDSPTSGPLPCYQGAVYVFPETFNVLFFCGQGTSVGEDLYIIILSSPDLVIELPVTVTYPA